MKTKISDTDMCNFAENMLEDDVKARNIVKILLKHTPEADDLRFRMRKYIETRDRIVELCMKNGLKQYRRKE